MPSYTRSTNALLRMIRSLTAKTGINQMVAGAKGRSLLEVFNDELQNITRVVNDTPLKAILSTSFGPYLEKIGTPIIGAPYPSRMAEVSFADRVIRFSTKTGVPFGQINNGSSFTIPEGTRLWSPADVSINFASAYSGINEPDNLQNRSINWVITNAAFCPAEATSIFVSARATSPGSSGNLPIPGILTRHSFSGYSDYVGNSLVVTNLKPILSGSNEETTESYRYRISKAWTAGEKANDTALGQSLLPVPGISDVFISRWVDGAGRFDIFIDSTSPQVSDNLIDESQRIVNEVQATGCIGITRKPFTIGVEIESTLRYWEAYGVDEINEIKQNAIVAAILFLNKKGLGQPLSLSNLASVIKTSDERIRYVGSVNNTDLDNVYAYFPARLDSSGRRREKILGQNLTVSSTSRIVTEPSLSNPIRFV